MLRLFRSISRGRRKGQHDAEWSPFARSPDTSQNRAENDFSDDEDDPMQDLSPHQRSNGMPSLFFRSHRDAAYRTINNQDDGNGDGIDEEDVDEDADEDVPLLPIFSAAILDKLPLYNITHAIRLFIVQRCETTLSWDQLRSPQISQFLVKPIESRIRSDHFNRATLCALIANCLQFRKEGQMSPGNVGVLRTRALISELLAMRLLREFTTRELIDALSYDFDPLQGMVPQGADNAHLGQRQLFDLQTRRAVAKGARLSTIEIAIRAEAKRFLAHPLVVQHLEAIWAGNIVFQSKADHLHRNTRRSRADYLSRTTDYGTISEPPAEPLSAKNAPGTGSTYSKIIEDAFARRTVTLYNPRYASVFKLSRLRVPRYRQVFTTISFAIMLGLFVAVLIDHSVEITPLEIIFWFWSAGYMLDEVVGFTEQGFGLYLLSFWNAFDVGILLLFAVYYCLRLYSIVLDGEWKEQIANNAYDILASTAILLFPRLFNILDHYRYFSQLLIAFRLMMQDLIAILILISISASGFFVAFVFGMSKHRTSPNEVAWTLFQMVMGFTPAAWDNWGSYNILGQIILGSFLILCHFLIVTILITVLTNSFMAIVKNAEEEHQFLFAINTISMVKSDALFSYVAPTNIIGWVLSPLRFIIPLQQYVRFNRTMIKITHSPILFIIFAYERLFLGKSAFTPAELVDSQPTKRKEPIAFTLNKPPDLFSPSLKMREPSLINFNKNRALDEVFRKPFKGETLKTTAEGMHMERRGSGTAVDRWMQAAEVEGGAGPPLEQPRSVLERLEHRRPQFKRAVTADRLKMLTRSRDFSVATRSVASDPDATSLYSTKKPPRIEEESDLLNRSLENLPQETDADGDDEINDQSDHPTPTLDESAVSIPQPRIQRHGADENDDYFKTPTGVKTQPMKFSKSTVPRIGDFPGIGFDSSDGQISRRQIHRVGHNRNHSSGTILFAPRPNPLDFDLSESSRAMRPRHTHNSRREPGNTPPSILLPSEHPTRPRAVQSSKPRPTIPNRQKTAPALVAAATGLSFLNQHNQRRPSLTTRALDLASEIGDNRWNPSGFAATAEGAPSMVGSFSEQLMRERERQRRAEEEEKGMVSRILLSRMATLEEGFREVLREVKDLSNNSSQQAVNSSSRRQSDGDDSTAGFQALHRGSGGRSRVDTGSSSPSASLQMPKTVIGRISGLNDGKKGKSPRKAVARKESRRKGKEAEEGSSRITGENQQPGAETGSEEALVQPSPDSVVGLSKSPKEQEPIRRNTVVKVDDQTFDH